MSKDFLNFISLDLDYYNQEFQEGISKINHKKILNNIPLPITLWELQEEDFILIYSNKASFETIKPKLSTGVHLSKTLPIEYKKIFSPISLYDSNNSSTQVMLDKNLLLIIHSNVEKFQPEQKRIEDQNFYKKTLFKTFFEQSPVSIIITDIQGNIKYVNPKFLEVTGYTKEEILDKNPRILKSGNTTSEEYKILWDTILSGEIWKGEFINKRKNGEIYYEFAVISPIKDDNDVVKNFIALKEDITKLKETNEELRRSERLAALGRMAAYVSHEIKTPLTSIKINLDILGNDNAIDSNSKKLLHIMQKEVKRLTNLLKNILMFSNQSKINFSDIDLKKLVEHVKEFLDPLLNEKNVTLFNNINGHYVYGDAQQLRSLFIHLIENSLESMEEGGKIELSSELRENQCYIYVKDNGCGIICPENIFEPFITTKSTGTGLGLPIAKNIIDKHNGTIKLVSTKEGETIFEITLSTRGKKIEQTTNN